jgi:dihydrofolate reductase
MKTILYLGQTINGYIADKKDSTPWSKEEFAAFHSTITKAKNIMVGRKTYEIMRKYGEFKKCGNPFTVIITKSQKFKPADKLAIASAPSHALKILKSKGFEVAFMSGGSTVATSFMKEGLIDEIWIDIEPLIFGKGIPIFQESKLNIKLRMIKTTKISKNTIQLRYKVLK